MAKFNLDDYELVEDRLKKYWKDNPEGMISTNVVHITEDGTCVTIKADVTDNNGRLVATGIAQETKGDGFANTTSWVENCETSAIGRALANWKYQGSKKARPSKEEMSKVSKEPPTKKAEPQKTGQSPSKITEVALKDLVFSQCGEDKNFAKQAYDVTMKRVTLASGITDDVTTWSDEIINEFLKLIKIYVDKFRDDFEAQAGNTETINNALSILDAKEIESEDDMAEIKEGPWMQEPISEGQVNFIEMLIKQAIDDGLDELGAEAKQYLNSGNATKGNASQMIDKLKDALS